MKYIENVRSLFEYYKSLGSKAIGQVPDNKLSWQYNDESNSIGTIVKHLHGNMLSRWTDFLNSDGEKEFRDRDGEFLNDLTDRVQIINKYNEGWEVLFSALDSVSDDQLDKIVYIRNEGHTVTEAINRQLVHYAYHIGQIVYIARMVGSEKWNSLSIPKGGSKEYNKNKFSKDKTVQHFTKEV